MRRVLIANRGEIAARVARACFDEGLETVLACSEADRETLAARLADRVVVIGPPSPLESYLSVERVVAAALTTDCDALHPGYGFLSERPELAAACEENGITFIGPPADVMRGSGDKLKAREMAADLGIPTGGGTRGLADAEEAVALAEELDLYPCLIKASAGGGGRGMTIVRSADDLRASFARSSQEAERAFGDGTVYLERYVERARHVEVQVLADTHGNVVHLGERDCSTQRRYQKLIEEAPAVGLPDAVRDGMRDSAVRLARALGYVSAGTVEFLVDTDRNEFVFLELNARVQVEHPVTEMVTGVDVVREQIRVARGEPLSVAQPGITVSGHAIECRINAESPRRDFLPSPGRVERWTAPQGHGVRVDTFVENGATISPYYDSMVAKLIVHAPDRAAAIDLMLRALARTEVRGIETTIPFHAAVLGTERFRESPVTTRWVENEFLPAWLEGGE
ncbi:acetyl-CoA carboxylase biotin carboxylase subunit [Acrocarpospora catenulata]|uniref:acetyl-CoA carboxylase biotin carboxylase subunit n=1 Tax=Acrocarpospora catenulata TaxID=2836182 RepID=UPI001BD96445|nr:biotin carboxylase N-terminal domain-containing protein [Acrocarpospora catenulata]